MLKVFQRIPSKLKATFIRKNKSYLIDLYARKPINKNLILRTLKEKNIVVGDSGIFSVPVARLFVVY
jgi:hypothetical protein